MSSTKTTTKNLNESNEQEIKNQLTIRKRNYKTLTKNDFINCKTSKSSSKKMKLTNNGRPPLPDLTLNDHDNEACYKNKSNIYEFEKIVADRPSEIRKGKKQHLIHWKNYPLYEAS